jgi:signal transduction histidine kinase
MPRRRFQQLWLWWAFVILLAILCATLGVLQSRWLDEISSAEQDRMHAALDARLNRLSRDFDTQIGQMCSGLIPGFQEIQNRGSRAACSLQYRRWIAVNGPVFQRIGLVAIQAQQPTLALLDPVTGEFTPAEWPVAWSGIRKRFEARANRLEIPPLPAAESALLEFSLFGSAHGVFSDWRLSPGGLPLEDWLVLELDTAYLRSDLLPRLMRHHFNESGATVYDARVVADSAPKITVIGDTGEAFDKADATVGLLNPGRIRAGREGGPPAAGGPGPGPPRDREHLPPPVGGPSRWRLLIHERGNSLEDQIAQARRRNFGLSAGILLLILTAVVVLLHFSRRSQQLAELQMNFVAGVSHELRTPLTVIRTAAFNLRGRVATRPEQVERYGELIQNESEKLGLLVDQVLRYGAAASGRVIGPRVPIAPQALIESTLKGSSLLSDSGIAVEQHITPDLPEILADEVALRHALQNLIENAVKYGQGGDRWIGLSAEMVPAGRVPSRPGGFVQITVTDRGPGIPANERASIFDAFYRGKRALRDQVHGTGLGLNIVKSIVEAHGGTIEVISEPGQGAAFRMRLPAALPQAIPEEAPDGIANLTG